MGEASAEGAEPVGEYEEAEPPAASEPVAAAAEPVADQGDVAHEPEDAPPTEEHVSEPHAEVAEAPSAAKPEPEPEPEPEVEEPSRPRRSGWWQRAKSTLVGG